MLHRALLATIALVLAGPVHAEDQPVAVPDPYGLGERLALIDWLHGHGQETEPGTGIADLRARYLEASPATASTPSIAAGAPAEPDAEREAAALELWRRHAENPTAGSDAAAIRERIAALDAERGRGDAEERARQDERDATLSAKPRPAGVSASPTTPAAGAGKPPATAAPAAKPPVPARTIAEIREVKTPRDMGDETRAYLISPDSSPILIVVCDASLRGVMEPILASWPASERLAAGVDGTIIIHGHSDGGNFNDGVLKQTGAIGGDLAEHLRRNREFYETLGGTRPRRTLDMAVMTGCNAGGFNQERELKDGLGYRPLHRVFTTPECLDCAATCLPAIIAAGSTRFDFSKPYRAKFTLSEKLAAHGDRKYAVSSYSAVDQDAFDVHDQVKRFIVSDAGITEDR